MKSALIATSLLGMVLVCACDEKPKLPANYKPTNEPAVIPGQRPTTEQILAAPRELVQLVNYPLRMEVPNLWKQEAIGTGLTVILHGPAPHGDIIITVSRLQEHASPAPALAPAPPPPGGDSGIEASSGLLFTPGQVKEFVRAATRASTNPSDPKVLTTVRSAGPMQIVETRRILPATPPIIQGGQLLPGDPAKWEMAMNAYVPEGDKMSGYRMMYDVPVEQYDLDKDFLQSIWQSLRYDPTAPKDTVVPKMGKQAGE